MNKAKDYLTERGIENDVIYDNSERAHDLECLLNDFAQEQVKNIAYEPVLADSLPLEKLHNWCDNEGTEVGAEIILRADNIDTTIINCTSKASLAEFKDKIGNDS